MANVLIRHLSLSNFCNINNLSADFNQKTLIRGFNREGKSTIRNAILWVLTGKLSDGSSADDNIRPHDVNGNRIDGIDITVSLTVSVDGTDYILTKIQKQKWVKKRGSESQEFQGNENLYEISGVPKKAKDFEQFINDNICPIADLPFCINANTFLTLDAKKRRAKILSLGKDFSNDEIIDKFPEFDPLRADLKVGTIEELTSRSKKAISELKKQQVELPTRIDEVSKSIVELDFAEYEIQRNDIKERLKAIEAVGAKQTEIRKDINKAQFELQTVKEKLVGGLKDKRTNLKLEKSDLRSILSSIQNDMSFGKSKAEQYRQNIAACDARIMEIKDFLRKAVSEEYNPDTFVCPTCGQLFPTDKQEQKRLEFEETKAIRISRFNEDIEKENENKHKYEAMLKETEAKLSDLENKAADARNKITAKNMEMESLPSEDSVNYADDPEYKAVQQKIDDLQARLSACVSADDKNDLMVQLAEVERKLAQKDANTKAEERIGELKDELKSVAERILQQEGMLHLLEQFNVKRIEMLEASVNQYFGMIKWLFFQPQINGGYQEVCKATVAGTDYDTLLNKSDRLLCQLDLCNGFQKAAGVQLLLMVDDCESVDNGRIPETDNQLIMFRRDDCKLTVEGA